MTTRIGLFTHRESRKKGQASTTTDYVEVTNAADLAAKVAALGGKRVGLLRKDREGTTHLEGDMFPTANLTDKHMTWLTEKPAEFQTRGLFYD
jgi:hypothetical protein